jgi:hypothetical protein
MKMKWLAVSLVAATITAMMPAQAMAYYCVARSPTGSSGWGVSGSLGNAKGIALYQCAIRTPKRYYCYITYCS